MSTCGGRYPGLGLCGSGSRCTGHPRVGRAAPRISSPQSCFLSLGNKPRHMLSQGTEGAGRERFFTEPAYPAMVIN